MNEKKIERAARAIAREFLATDCAKLDERDYEEDFARNRGLYLRMAVAAWEALSADAVMAQLSAWFSEPSVARADQDGRRTAVKAGRKAACLGLERGRTDG
jgi:hypothetical protein